MRRVGTAVSWSKLSIVTTPRSTRSKKSAAIRLSITGTGMEAKARDQELYKEMISRRRAFQSKSTHSQNWSFNVSRS
jgi:hypothetical protein